MEKKELLGELFLLEFFSQYVNESSPGPSSFITRPLHVTSIRGNWSNIDVNKRQTTRQSLIPDKRCRLEIGPEKQTKHEIISPRLNHPVFVPSFSKICLLFKWSSRKNNLDDDDTWRGFYLRLNFDEWFI